MKTTISIILIFHSIVFASIYLELSASDPYLGSPVTVNIISTNSMSWSGYVVLYNATFQSCTTYPKAGNLGGHSHYPMPPNDAYYIYSADYIQLSPGIHHSVTFILSEYLMTVELFDDGGNSIDVLNITTLGGAYVEADAGGPYVLYKGESLILDGSASTFTGLANGIEGYNWEIENTYAGSGKQLVISYQYLISTFGQGIHPIKLTAWGIDHTGAIVDDQDETTLEMACAFNITSPQPSSAWNSGGQFPIQWNTLGEVETIKIEYSVDAGSNWILIGQMPNSGCYLWLVPKHTSQTCLIRISDTTDKKVFETSESFTMYECTLLSDLNHDCIIDLNDFSILAMNWLACGNPFDPSCVSL